MDGAWLTYRHSPPYPGQMDHYANAVRADSQPGYASGGSSSPSTTEIRDARHSDRDIPAGLRVIAVRV